MTILALSEINIYPVKSFAGASLTSVQLDRFGPTGDRRWMLDAGCWMLDPAAGILRLSQTVEVLEYPPSQSEGR